MYRFSRSIYREVAPYVVEDDRDPTGCRNKQSVLDACEAAIRRLAYDGQLLRAPRAVAVLRGADRTSRCATRCGCEW